MWVIGPWKNEAVEFGSPNTQPPARKKWPPGTSFRRARLLKNEVALLTAHPGAEAHPHTIRATAPMRTAVDIARFHGFREGLIAFDWLLKHTPETKANVMAYIESLGRLKGIATARACLAAATHNSGSPYESFARAILIEAGLTNLITQHPIRGFYIDIYLEPGVCIEVDGAGKYLEATYQQPTAETLRLERKREKGITNAGYTFIRVSPSQLHQAPAEFVADVRRALARQRVIAVA